MRKKPGKIALLGKFKSNSREIKIYKVLIHSNNSHNEFALINNVLKEYIKEEIKNLKTETVFSF